MSTSENTVTQAAMPPGRDNIPLNHTRRTANGTEPPDEARCALATGSLPVSSAEVFKALMTMAAEYEAVGLERTSDTIRLVAEEYRRHEGSKNRRQPAENSGDEPRAEGGGSNPKPL